MDTADLAQTLRNFGQAAFAVVGIFGVFFGVIQYRRSVRTDENELLHKLFQSFYESHIYEPVRQCIDEIDDGLSEAEAEQRLLHTDQAPPNESDLVNYLNFFEFLLGLIERGRLKRRDVEWVFEYYICRLFEVSFIRDYIFAYGFESLQAEHARQHGPYTPPARDVPA